MTKVKQIIKLFLHLVMTFIAMLIAYILSTMVIGQNSTTLTVEETSQG